MLNTKKALAIDPYLIALFIALLIVTVIRYRLLPIPFERDEGEYAYIGNLMLHGGVPYRDVYNMKLPGTYAMYSIIIAFLGTSPTGIHTGLLVVSLVTMIFLFLSFKKLFNPIIGLVAATIYGLLSVTRPFLGFAAHATHFINLFMALGLFFYGRFFYSRKHWYAGITGLMFGLAFIMKQQAVFLIALGAMMILLIELFNKPFQKKSFVINSTVYVSGAFIPYSLVVIIMISTGAFRKFYFWTVMYAREYAASNRDWSEVKFKLFGNLGVMIHNYPGIWFLAAVGLIVLWIGKYSKMQKWFVVMFVLFSFACVCPGLYFRDHYFVVFIPAVALLAAITLDYFVGLIPNPRNSYFIKLIPFVVVLLFGFVTIAKDRYYYFDDPVNVINKKCYGIGPFIEAPEIAKYIENNTVSTDKIGILGSEPEVLVYAHRQSASCYIYTYPLMELHRYNRDMQHEMITQIEAAKPPFIIFYSPHVSWDQDDKSPWDIFAWFDNYSKDNYTQVCLVDVSRDSDKPSKFYWGAESLRTPADRNYIRIFKRN